MKDSFWYPIVFMLIMVVIFTSILSVMYRFNQDKIMRQERDSYQRAVLSTLASAIAEYTGESRESIMAAYPESYDTYVVSQNYPGFERECFQAKVDDEILAYCFEIRGKGLWGSMQALVSTSVDLRTILDFAIVSQQETPGLGARIEEDWFLSQFRDRLFVVNPDAEGDVSQSYEFIAETQVPENDRQLRRVTGATITSDSVVKMLHDEFNYIYKYFRENVL
nr:Na+-transporting NADH:ubiquinone oxidoreductase subunit [Candidatus Cloacimonadota bacterium]